MALRRGAALLSMVLGAGLSGGCARTPRPEPDFGRTPVLLVHGLGEGSAIWRPLVASLVASGYPAPYLLAIDLSPGGDNTSAAESVLAPAATRLLERAALEAARTGSSAPTHVDLVAHSMGALSARYFAARVRPEVIRTLVTIAGANHGSDRFCGAGEPPGAKEMCPAFASEPADAIQVRLNGTALAPLDETPWGAGEDPTGRPRTAPDSARRIRYATIDSRNEAWIIPDSSTQLAGSGGWDVEPDLPSGMTRAGPGRFVVPDTDHDAIVHHRGAMVLIELLLVGPSHPARGAASSERIGR